MSPETHRLPAEPEPPLEGTAPFVEGCRRGALVLLRCESCGSRILPDVAVCERCGSVAWEPEEASGAGTVFSSTVVHRAPEERFAARVPYVIALVDLDEGPRMMGVLDGVPVEPTHIGQRVRVRFRDDGGAFPTPYFVLDDDARDVAA